MNHRKLRSINGNSVLYGINYGSFPKRVFHNFSALGKMCPRHPVSLHSCGIDCWHREVFRERINSDTFSVELVVDGIFRYTLDGKSYRVHPGEIFFVQQGMNSSMCCETENATKRLVIIDGTALQHTLETLKLDRIATLIPTDLPRITAILDRIAETAKVCSFENFNIASVECYHLLLELSSQHNANDYPAELQHALEFIHENLHTALTLEQIIKHVQSSNATLHRQFRKHLNVSPIEYYLNAKMDMACGLLKSGEFSVKEVASKLNYSSSQYFSSEFKKRYGKTPSEIK